MHLFLRAVKAVQSAGELVELALGQEALLSLIKLDSSENQGLSLTNPEFLYRGMLIANRHEKAPPM